MSSEVSLNNDGGFPKPDIIESNEESCSLLANYTYISPEELARYHKDLTSHDYDIIIILDARLIYEFQGGRIVSAYNVTKYSTLFKIFDKLIVSAENGKSICIVIHCEFSSKRGPKLLRKFRELDRQYNYENYPNVTFPNLFLLEGGYKKFYEMHSELCIGKYVNMHDK